MSLLKTLCQTVKSGLSFVSKGREKKLNVWNKGAWFTSWKPQVTQAWSFWTPDSTPETHEYKLSVWLFVSVHSLQKAQADTRWLQPGSQLNK